jgi:predicted ribosome quality control (RQC) complex YloA/Tae2 family protein
MTCAWSEKPEERTISLVAELMGPASNLLLIDHQGMIQGALFPPSAGRGLEIGAPYRSPKRAEAATFKEESIPPLEVSPFSFNRSAEAYYRALEEKEEHAERSRAARTQIEEGVRRVKKKLSAIEAGLTEAQGADRHRFQGELLKGHLHQIKPGMSEITVFDPARSEEIVLPLDPALSPSENLERFFKRYKKAHASRSMLQARMKETQIELKQLEDQRALLEKHPPGVAFPAPAPKEKREKKQGPPSFLSTDNLTLIVGRNGRENEEITFRIARGNDLWFHARGVPGSHLVVRMERRKEIPYQTLLDAATLSLHFSDGRKAGKGDVVYTFRKYVQKSKGGKPGAVILSQEKNIYIEIEPERLERLFQNKV